MSFYTTNSDDIKKLKNIIPVDDSEELSSEMDVDVLDGWRYVSHYDEDEKIIDSDD